MNYQLVIRMSSLQQFAFRMEGLEPPPWPAVTQPPIQFNRAFLTSLRNMKDWPSFPLHTPAMPTSFPPFQHATTGASQPTPTLTPSASPHSNALPSLIPVVNHASTSSAPTPGPSTSSAPTSGPSTSSVPTSGPSTSSVPTPEQGPSVSPQSDAFSGQEGSARQRCDSGITEMVAPLLTYFSQGMDVLLRSVQTSQVTAQEAIMKEIGTIREQLGTSRQPGEEPVDSLAKSPKKARRHFVATNPESSPTVKDKQEHSAFMVSFFLHSACF